MSATHIKFGNCFRQLFFQSASYHKRFFPTPAPCIPLSLLSLPFLYHFFLYWSSELLPRQRQDSSLSFSWLPTFSNHFLIKTQHSSHHNSQIKVLCPTRWYLACVMFCFLEWFVPVTEKALNRKNRVLDQILSEHPRKYVFRTGVFVIPVATRPSPAALLLIPGYHLSSLILLSQFRTHSPSFSSVILSKKKKSICYFLLKWFIQQVFPFMEEKWGWK